MDQSWKNEINALVIACICVFGVGCVPDKQYLVIKPKDANDSVQTPVETLIAQVRNNKDSRPDIALRAATTLTKDWLNTPEAKEASALIPALESACAKEEAEQKEVDRKRIESEKKAAMASIEKERKARLAAKWNYNTYEDDMTSKQVRTASIVSENVVEFGFPYEGAQRGTMTLRSHPTYGQDVIFQLEKGQILGDSYKGFLVRVRFDQHDPENWKATESADHDSTIIFLQDYDRFLNKLRKSKTVRIQIRVYQEGEPSFEFSVGGFDKSTYDRN